jgi:pimeloyl-ACP methyl ester carboxylesterase
MCELVLFINQRSHVLCVINSRWFDIYPNIDNIKKVKAPVFIIHGTADVEIPVHHGQVDSLAYHLMPSYKQN